MTSKPRFDACVADFHQEDHLCLVRLEWKLRVVQGNNIITVKDYGLQVPQLRMPHKFKILEFDKMPKYTPKTLPPQSLWLISLFQESLMRWARQ